MGIDPERFWNITPREVKREMDAAIYNEIERRNHLASMAWHTAVFSRTKKIPKLETLLIPHGPKKITSQPEPWEVSYAKMAAWAIQSKRKH